MTVWISDYKIVIADFVEVLEITRHLKVLGHGSIGCVSIVTLHIQHVATQSAGVRVPHVLLRPDGQERGTNESTKCVKIWHVYNCLNVLTAYVLVSPC